MHISKKTLILIFAFLLLWIIQAVIYVYNQDLGVPTLNDRFRYRDFSTSSKELNQNDRLTATFKSHYPNLGILQVRFNNFNRMSDDILRFRIKEKGQTEWYYQADYKTDQFQNNQLFPFGFPLIQDSENKEYEFEIVSLRGNKQNNVGPSTSFPSFVAKHIYSRSILDSKEALFSFVLNKSFNVITDPNILIRSFSYLIPFIIYSQIKKFIDFTKLRKFITSNLSRVKIIILISILLELILGEQSYNGFFLSILVLWIVIIRNYDVQYKTSASMGGYLIFFIPFLSLLGFPKQAEKVFEWVVIFFTIGVVQVILSKIKRKLGTKHFLVKATERYFVKR